MIKDNKWRLIIYSIIILLPAIVGIIIWDYLPEQVATHWDTNGEVDGWSSKGFATFGISIIFLVMFWLCAIITNIDKTNKDQSRKIINIVLGILPIIAIFTQGYIYTVALGKDIDETIIVRALIGYLFLLIGNYLPKCKQNNTIGIKVTWTLQNEENWNKTHRFTGRLWVIGGLLFLVTIFIPMDNYVDIMIIVISMTIIPIIYSYLYHRKQLKAGA